MDGDRFDALAKALGSDAGRRGVLAKLLGGTLASLLGARETDAAGKKRHGKRGKRDHAHEDHRQAADRSSRDISAEKKHKHKKKKSAVCHDGKTIKVAKKAVKAHLAHGDTRGPCPSQDIACPACGTCDACEIGTADEAGTCGLACQDSCTAAALCEQARDDADFVKLVAYLKDAGYLPTSREPAGKSSDESAVAALEVHQDGALARTFLLATYSKGGRDGATLVYGREGSSGEVSALAILGPEDDPQTVVVVEAGRVVPHAIPAEADGAAHGAARDSRDARILGFTSCEFCKNGCWAGGLLIKWGCRIGVAAVCAGAEVASAGAATAALLSCVSIIKFACRAIVAGGAVKLCRAACNGSDYCCHDNCVDARCCDGSCCDKDCCGGLECCQTGQECCWEVGVPDSGCFDLASDENHCGTCFHRCPEGQTCDGGVCSCAGASCEGSCCNGACCPYPKKCCDGECIDPSTDSRHCDGCFRACPQGERCEPLNYGGYCTCDSGVHCGDHGVCCPFGTTCRNARCECPDGREVCGNTCCDSEAECSDGACIIENPCPPERHPELTKACKSHAGYYFCCKPCNVCCTGPSGGNRCCAASHCNQECNDGWCIGGLIDCDCPMP